jgi:hypothetical protein
LSSLPTITLPPRVAVSLGEARQDFKTRLIRRVATADPVRSKTTAATVMRAM